MAWIQARAFSLVVRSEVHRGDLLELKSCAGDERGSLFF